MSYACFYLAKKNEIYHQKPPLNKYKTAILGRKMFENTNNIPLESLIILYMFF